MSEITGIVENIDGNNLYLKGHERPYFALETARFHLKEYQPGDGARIVLPKKGEFSAIFPWTPPEGWEPPTSTVSPPRAGKVGAPAAAGGSVGTSPQGGPGKAETGPLREAPGKPLMPPNKDQLSVRQTCLTAAVELVINGKVPIDDLYAKAGSLENWVWRSS
jgi:hypothetical protein